VDVPKRWSLPAHPQGRTDESSLALGRPTKRFFRSLARIVPYQTWRVGYLVPVSRSEHSQFNCVVGSQPLIVGLDLTYRF